MRRRKIAAWLAAFLWMMCCMAAAPAEVEIRLEPAEWTWEAGEPATFTGVILTDGDDLTDAVLQLRAETRLEDAGRIYFSEVNGQKIKAKKRSDTEQVSLAGHQTENTFVAEWYPPEQDGEPLAFVNITLTVQDGSGNELNAAEMQVGDAAEEIEAVQASPVQRIRSLIMMLLVSGCVTWALALIRFGLVNRKRAAGQRR